MFGFKLAEFFAKVDAFSLPHLIAFVVFSILLLVTLFTLAKLALGAVQSMKMSVAQKQRHDSIAMERITLSGE